MALVLVLVLVLVQGLEPGLGLEPALVQVTTALRPPRDWSPPHRRLAIMPPRPGLNVEKCFAFCFLNLLVLERHRTTIGMELTVAT